jgi:hypothetical protein
VEDRKLVVGTASVQRHRVLVAKDTVSARSRNWGGVVLRQHACIGRMAWRSVDITSQVCLLRQ